MNYNKWNYLRNMIMSLQQEQQLTRKMASQKRNDKDISTMSKLSNLDNDIGILSKVFNQVNKEIIDDLENETGDKFKFINQIVK